MVHDFATRYFDLPQNHTSIIGDAIEIVNDMQSRAGNDNLYSYIVHDVFTGGAEPIDLFTQEFLGGLSNLLKPEGVIAIVRYLVTVTNFNVYANGPTELRWRSFAPFRNFSSYDHIARLSHVSSLP